VVGEVFRDWCFANSREALLIMGRIEAYKEYDTEKLDRHYQSYAFFKDFLDRMVEAGLYESNDTLLDASLCIAALWGAISLTLTNRTHPKYWSKRSAKEFTDKMIDFIFASLVR
jgi:hypothetical protein